MSGTSLYGMRLWPIIGYLAGSLLLPIAPFGPQAENPNFFTSVLGNALPYGPLINRATILGGLSLLMAGLIAWSAPSSSRKLRWLDVPMLCWIICPTVAGVFNASPFRQDIQQSVYLAFAWGAPYAVGRLCITHWDDLRICLLAFLIAGGVTFGFALIEFAGGRFYYEAIYGPHPFQMEGKTRYFGYRPLLMMEDPNQFGMWFATVAIIACAFWLNSRQSNQYQTDAGPWLKASRVLVLPVFLFQAIGASVLSVFGMSLLIIQNPRVLSRGLLFAGALAVVLFACRGPILHYARQSLNTVPAARSAKAWLQDHSLGSLSWRLAREDDHLALIRQHPIVGWGDINFWRLNSDRVRPWGLVTLIAGAYGTLGVLCWVSLTVTPILAWFLSHHADDQRFCVFGKTVLVLLVVQLIDAFLNSGYLLTLVVLHGGMTSNCTVFCRTSTPGVSTVETKK